MLQTPYYLIDTQRLLQNMEKMDFLRQHSGAKVLLALKCFATWSVFDHMREHMDGTTSSSLYELKLGHDRFGKESHAYSVAWADHEIAEAVGYSDKIIFNSIAQLQRYADQAKAVARGLRVNPGLSSSSFDLADPTRPFSRLGESDPAKIAAVLPLISGLMFHNNCENESLERFEALLDHIESRFGDLLAQVSWVSLGGGIHFTGDGYPLERLAKRLKAFAERYHVQVYLEPGEAAITGCASLEVTVLDTGSNGKDFAVVDSSIEAHMLDLLIYRLDAKCPPNEGDYPYLVYGKSCLAGDVFGEFRFKQPLHVGDRLSFADAAGYTMVKKNWFNGVNMPAIVVKERDGSLRVVREFGYPDYESSLS